MKSLTLLVVIAILSMLTVQDAQSASLPACPSGTVETIPPYAEKGDPPAVASWFDLDALSDNCHIALKAPAALTIALAATFSYAGTATDIAARLGAISETQGLQYWSVSDDDWRELVTESRALESPDAKSVRADFTAQEILSGQTLYFAQNDSRSWGFNILAMNMVDSSADHLVFKSYNVSAIRMGPVKLIGPENAQSVLFLERVDRKTWKYYSLAVIKRSALAAREKSLINRQYAFFRFLIQQRADEEPPLAP